MLKCMQRSTHISLADLVDSHTEDAVRPQHVQQLERIQQRVEEQVREERALDQVCVRLHRRAPQNAGRNTNQNGWLFYLFIIHLISSISPTPFKKVRQHNVQQNINIYKFFLLNINDN